MTRQRRVQVIAFFALILAVDWFLYFRHAGHFFQGDTVFLLGNRAGSIAEFFAKEFAALSPSGWYRPLANEVFESILYPFAGLNPIPYRIPVYAVFVAITILVYVLALTLTRRHLAAALAAFFFTIHNTNAYTTYDLGFMPELLFTLFYIGAVLAFLRYIEDGSKAAYRVSLACFLGSLLSKEAAVTLPGTLFLAAILFDSFQSFRERFVRAVRSIAPYALILIAYLAFGLGYLHIQGLSIGTLLNPPHEPAPGDYSPVISSGVLRNADVTLSLAFNLPRGEWRPGNLGSGTIVYLKFFRVLILAMGTIILFKSERKTVLFGFGWFWIAMIPALTLVTHFLAYYLFLPLVGLSLVVGVVLVWLYDFIRRFQPAMAAAVIVAIFGGILAATSRSIPDEIERNALLGGSSSVAWNTLKDLKRLYPALPAGTTLYFADANEVLVWHHDHGGLIKMAYETDKVSTLYQSQEHWLLPETPNVLVFDVRNGRLIDETAQYRFNPIRLMKFVKSDLKLELSTAEVTAGKGKYVLRIRDLSDAVRIAYTIDNGPLEIFSAWLDREGKTTFEVSSDTKKGLYQFRAFSVSSDEWARAERALIVR